MEAPVVAVLTVTVCVEVYVPAVGLNVGAETGGGPFETTNERSTLVTCGVGSASVATTLKVCVPFVAVIVSQA